MASNGIKQLPSSLSSTFALQKDIHVNVPSGHQFDASSCQKEMSRRSLGMLGHASIVTIHSTRHAQECQLRIGCVLAWRERPRREETQWGPTNPKWALNLSKIWSLKSWRCCAKRTGTGLKGRFCKVRILPSTTTPKCCLADVLQLDQGSGIARTGQSQRVVLWMLIWMLIACSIHGKIMQSRLRDHGLLE